VTLSLPSYASVEVNQPLVFDVMLSQSLTDARSYDASIAVLGFDGHEVDCDCLKCELVRKA
jgi:hypothetical protein